MITYRIENEELIIDGEMKPGEKIKGLCCPSFDWEVTLIFPDSNPGYVSVWGFCNNSENCPNADEHPLFNGVSSMEQEDIALYLLELEAVK